MNKENKKKTRKPIILKSIESIVSNSGISAKKYIYEKIAKQIYALSDWVVDELIRKFYDNKTN